MGKVIEFQLDTEKCIGFAMDAIKHEDYLLAVHNLNEGLFLAKTRWEIRKIYTGFIMLFDKIDNPQARLTMIAKDAFFESRADFFRIDLLEFMDETKERYQEPIEDVAAFRSMYSFNEVKNLLLERRYEQAFEKMMLLPFREGQQEKISEYLSFMLETDDKLKAEKFLLPVVGMFARTQNNIRLIDAFLNHGNVMRSLAIDSASLICDEVDDVNLLIDLGEVFYINGEPETAWNFFAKALYFNPLQEEALYYSALIDANSGCLHTYNPEYFNRYRTIYECTDAPVALYLKYIEQARREQAFSYHPYPYLPPEFIDKVANELMEEMKKTTQSSEFYTHFTEFFMVAEEKSAAQLLSALSAKKLDKDWHDLLLKILRLPRVDDCYKKPLLEILISSGYEGGYHLYNDGRVICANIVAFPKEGSRFYQNLYKNLLASLPFSALYIPIKCNRLIHLAEKMEATYNFAEEDFPFATAVLMLNYLKKIGVTVDSDELNEYLGMHKQYYYDCLEKYDLYNIFL